MSSEANKPTNTYSPVLKSTSKDEYHCYTIIIRSFQDRLLKELYIRNSKFIMVFNCVMQQTKSMYVKMWVENLKPLSFQADYFAK
jgi:hypothetical protein